MTSSKKKTKMSNIFIVCTYMFSDYHHSHTTHNCAVICCMITKQIFMIRILRVLLFLEWARRYIKLNNCIMKLVKVICRFIKE